MTCSHGGCQTPATHEVCADLMSPITAVLDAACPFHLAAVVDRYLKEDATGTGHVVVVKVTP